MNRLLRIIIIIIIAFILASLVVFRLRLGRTMVAPRQETIDQNQKSEMLTAEGEIETVDPVAGRLILIDGGQTVILEFDDRTAIIQQGQVIVPAQLASGIKAKVRYRAGHDRNWARYIEIDPVSLSR